MSKTDENLSNIFDVTPISSSDSKNDIIEYVPKEVNDSPVEDDYSNTRKNLYGLLQQGEDALAHALEVAKMSEHPRAFEVVGGLIKQLSDINHQLLDLHTKKEKLSHLKNDKGEKTNQPQNVTNNAIFVGSTSELSKMIENMKKGE